MGGKCPHRSVKKRRYSHKTFRRAKFLSKDILFVVFVSQFKFFFVLIDCCYHEFFLDCWLFTWRRRLWWSSERGREEALARRWRPSRNGPVLLFSLRVILSSWFFFFLELISVSFSLFGYWSPFFFCSRYFANVAVRDEHFKSKRHRKRYAYFLLVQ